MMETLIVIVFEFLGEIAFELIIQVIFEAGLYKTFEAIKSPFRNYLVLEATGYVLAGGMIGGASVLVFPNSFIGHTDLRLLNLAITPILAGLAMAGIGAIRTKKGQNPIRLDSFAFGALFAFSLELVRLLFVR